MLYNDQPCTENGGWSTMETGWFSKVAKLLCIELFFKWKFIEGGVHYKVKTQSFLK